MHGYCKIENKGEVDVNAFRLMGASTKEGDSTKIGYFGSGIKYAITSALREGIPLRVFSGEKEIKITTKKATMANQSFDVVCINGLMTSLTTRMGKDWKTWFIFREFYCNAIDEGGMSVGISNEPKGEKGKTCVYIGMTESISKVMDDFNRYFSERRTAIHTMESVKIYPRLVQKMSVYRKGILVFSEHESLYDYDFPDLTISEARQASDFECEWHIVDFWKKNASEDMIFALLSNKAKNPKDFEYSMNWQLGTSYMGRVWHDVLKNKTIVPYEHGGSFEEDYTSSNVVVLPHKLCDLLHKTYGDKLKIRGFDTIGKGRLILPTTPRQQSLIDEAVQFFKAVGIDDIDTFPIKVAVLEAKTYGLAEEGEIFLSKELFDYGKRKVAEVLLEEYLHNKTMEDDRSRGFQSHLLNMLVASYEQRLNKYL